MLTGAPAGYCRADPCRSIFLFTAFLAKADGLQKMFAGHAVGVCVTGFAKFPERDDALNANDGFRLLAALLN
jgi:hypothetical protein